MFECFIGTALSMVGISLDQFRRMERQLSSVSLIAMLEKSGIRFKDDSTIDVVIPYSQLRKAVSSKSPVFKYSFKDIAK